jgi:hypothetical protein
MRKGKMRSFYPPPTLHSFPGIKSQSHKTLSLSAKERNLKCLSDIFLLFQMKLRRRIVLVYILYVRGGGAGSSTLYYLEFFCCILY